MPEVNKEEFEELRQKEQELSEKVNSEEFSKAIEADNQQYSKLPEIDSHDKDVLANKWMRRELDARLQDIKQFPKSRERSLAITKLQEAIMWLGMDLKRLGGPNPYPNSKDPSNTTIDPTADNLKL